MRDMFPKFIYLLYSWLVFTNTTENQSGSRSAVTMIKFVIKKNLVKERGNFNFGLWMNRVHNGMEARHGIRSLKLADCSLIHAHIPGKGRKWCEDINPQSSTLTFKYPNDFLLFVYCSFHFKIVCFST